ncbi:NUDIX domain-containing protein [Castellaniella sp.]|uniref:NUDIX hydrolase n=1 Tax=Castellaniella sp. TaxID=1955812 RepID=UPI00355F63D2
MRATVHIPDLAHLQACRGHLHHQAQQLPPAGARPVTLAGRVGGWITPAAQNAVAGLPGVHIEPEAVHITAAARRSLAAVLEQLAHALNQAGLIRAWRNELLDVVAEGQHLAQMERGAMRPLGLLTQSVHLNAWTPDGRLWVARRALDKSTDPGLWDTLSGGLVAARETCAAALLRETHEEAGLPAAMLAGHSPLRTVLRMHRRLPEGYQVENVLLADCVLPAAAVPVNQDGEVIEFRCLNMTDLQSFLGRGVFTLEAELCILDSLQLRLHADRVAQAS